jgi:hypothetical protein
MRPRARTHVRTFKPKDFKFELVQPYDDEEIAA